MSQTERLQHNNVRQAREKRVYGGDADQARALEIIRQGWYKLYGANP